MNVNSKHVWLFSERAEEMSSIDGNGGGDGDSPENERLNKKLSTEGAFPPTYMVLRLSPNIQPAAVSWLAKKITGKKQDGGSELLLRCEPFSGKKREVYHAAYLFVFLVLFFIVLNAL